MRRCNSPLSWPSAYTFRTWSLCATGGCGRITPCHGLASSPCGLSHLTAFLVRLAWALCDVANPLSRSKSATSLTHSVDYIAVMPGTCAAECCSSLRSGILCATVLHSHTHMSCNSNFQLGHCASSFARCAHFLRGRAPLPLCASVTYFIPVRRTRSHPVCSSSPSLSACPMRITLIAHRRLAEVALHEIGSCVLFVRVCPDQR